VLGIAFVRSHVRALQLNSFDVGEHASRALFPRYVVDVPDEPRTKLDIAFAEIRAVMRRALSGVQTHDEELIPESRAVHVLLGTAGIAAEEFKPAYMRGYGELPDPVAAALTAVSIALCDLLAAADHLVESAVAPHPSNLPKATPQRALQ
jgi:hypothetical protein